MKAILTLSGGMDSTVLLYHLLSQGHEVRTLSVNYGQRHSRELTAAFDVANAACMKFASLYKEHKLVDLHALKQLMGGSSQTDDVPVPEGHYAEESMKLTVVPNRNMILLSLAGAWAVSTKSDFVAYAAHSGDHAVYPDCRPEFAEAMSKALSMCDWHIVTLSRPFLHPTPMSKTDVCRLGQRLGVPFGLTWSCYKGGAKHCGVCGTCSERKESFKDSGVEDPTEYE